MVDTGSDNTVFPKSVADYLGIPLQASNGPLATVFGGHRVQLLTGEAVLKLEVDGESMAWRTVVCFFDFPSRDEETVILGHAGFLEYFTATFNGKLATLELNSNDEMPASTQWYRISIRPRRSRTPVRDGGIVAM